jgi:hypothetical protein
MAELINQKQKLANLKGKYVIGRKLMDDIKMDIRK